VLGYTPSINIRQGMQDTLEWFREERLRTREC
jgi:hypothetical protein